MARPTRGSTYDEPGGTVGIRWPEGDKRPQRGGFKNKTEARDWFDENVAPRLRRGGPSAEVTFDAFCDRYLNRWGSTVSKRTRATMVEKLAPARKQFGSWPLAELEGAADDVAGWRAGLPSDDQRYKSTKALRQVLAAAIRWSYITRNPAIDAGPNPKPRVEEVRPLSRDELDAVAAELSLLDAALVVFVAETGLRTAEWVALERKDIDRRNPAVAVSRQFASGTVKPYPKTHKSRRRVPLTPRALAALDSIPPRLDTPLLFPAAEGGHVILDNWRSRNWYPALDAAGVSQRGPYNLRHTFATEALAGGVSIYQLTRLMGASVETIEAHYGHLSRDSEGHLRELLSARSGVLVASADSEAGGEDA